MCLHSQKIPPVPEQTACVASSAFPKGNLYMRLRDELGVFYQDEDFASLYPQRGQPAQAPGAFSDDTGDAICAKISLIDKQLKQCKGELTGNMLCP